ncbi:Transcriptional regulatory protein BaeR [compost metagenome]
MLDGQQLELTRTEFALLERLARRPGRVFTRAHLMEEALGDTFAGFERTIDSHIRNLRRKLGDDPANPEFIQTVYGVGYKFNPDLNEPGAGL